MRFSSTPKISPLHFAVEWANLMGTAREPTDHHQAARLNDVLAYAARIGLRRFALAPPAGGEYVLKRLPSGTSYHKTAEVVSASDQEGRHRIKVPFRLFGNIVITEPQYMAGRYWYFDLIRAGYLFIHFVTRFDSYRALLPALLTRGLLERCRLHRVPSAVLWWMARSRAPSYSPEPGCVLLISENLRRGGNQRQLVTTVSGLLDRGYHVKMLILNRLGIGTASFEEDIVRLGVSPEFVSESVALARLSMMLPSAGRPPADLAALPRRVGFRITAIGAAITRHRPSVVHGWLDEAGVAGALAGCSAGAPRCVIRLGSMATLNGASRKPEWLREAYRALARNPTVTIVNNSYAGARSYEEWVGLPAKSIRVLYNGFNPNWVRTPDLCETMLFRASLGLSADMEVVGTLMRFSAEKDPDLWLDTAAEIAKMRPGARFLIGGSGPLEQHIRRGLDSRKLSERVVLAGAVTDIGLMYSAMEVVLLTSATEGTPNVIIEAQAAGLPVVATDAGGTREAVAEGLTGIIVTSRSAPSLARAAVTVLDDAGQRSQVRIYGPQFVARRFDLGRMLDETVEHYKPSKGS
jgi:glycosyltransferase involved in cell wall biosynthesis